MKPYENQCCIQRLVIAPKIIICTRTYRHKLRDAALGTRKQGFSSYIDSYCFMVIASSPFPCTTPWICICLGGVQKIQGPHILGCCPWGEPSTALHPSQGISSKCLIVSNLTNLYETRNSYERQTIFSLVAPVKLINFNNIVTVCIKNFVVVGYGSTGYGVD